MGAIDISQNDNNFADTAADIDDVRMEDSAAIECFHRGRGMVDHATGTTDEFDATIMEESAEMVHSQPAMGLIHHTTGGVDAIFGENVGDRHGKGNYIHHGWMSHGSHQRGPQNDSRQQPDNYSHLKMLQGGGQEYNHNIGHFCCHYFPCHHQI